MIPEPIWPFRKIEKNNNNNKKKNWLYGLDISWQPMKWHLYTAHAWTDFLIYEFDDIIQRYKVWDLAAP